MHITLSYIVKCYEPRKEFTSFEWSKPLLKWGTAVTFGHYVPRTKFGNILFLLCFLFRSSVSTEDFIVILQFLFLINYYFSFSYSISLKRLDGFSWNFQGWCVLVQKDWKYFLCEDVISSPRYKQLFSDFEGCRVFQRSSPKRLKISSSNFHGW